MRGTCDICGRHHRVLIYIEDPNTFENAVVCDDSDGCHGPETGPQTEHFCSAEDCWDWFPIERGPFCGGDECVADRGLWWVIHEAELLKALRKAHAGDSPDVVLMELTANSERGEQ